MTPEPAPGPPEELHVELAVDPDRLDTVLPAIEEAGATVEQVLAGLGVVSVRAPRSALAAIEAVDGVSAVEPEREVQLPPPEDEVQ